MATEVIHTIGTGETYTTITAWEAAQQRNLVSADEIAVAELKAQDFDEDLQVNGWTVDSTRHLIIRAATGAKYDVAADTGAKLYRTGTPGMDIYNLTYFEDIRIGSFSYDKPWYPRGADNQFKRCAILSSGVITVVSSGSPVFENCVIRQAAYTSTENTYNATGAFNNCTVIVDNTYGQIIRNATCYNTVIYNAQSSPTWGNFFNCTGDYNASTDTSSPGANSVDSITSAAFADYANSDYSIDDTGSALYGAANSASVSFTDDFEGTTRSSWDIGAYEYVAVGGVGGIRNPMGGPIQLRSPLGRQQ